MNTTQPKIGSDSPLNQAWKTWNKQTKGLCKNYKNWENFILEDMEYNISYDDMWEFWFQKTSKGGKQ